VFGQEKAKAAHPLHPDTGKMVSPLDGDDYTGCQKYVPFEWRCHGCKATLKKNVTMTTALIVTHAAQGIRLHHEGRQQIDTQHGPDSRDEKENNDQGPDPEDVEIEEIAQAFAHTQDQAVA
jgi:hypothetical protein